MQRRSEFRVEELSTQNQSSSAPCANKEKHAAGWVTVMQAES